MFIKMINIKKPYKFFLSHRQSVWVGTLALQINKFSGGCRKLYIYIHKYINKYIFILL